MTDARRRNIDELARKLRRLERAHRGAAAPHELLSTGIPGLDPLLPEGGLHRGMLIEWMAPDTAAGAGTLAWMVAAALQHREGTGTGAGACVVIDRGRSLYPPALVRLGVDLSHVLVVHPARDRDALWALEQALRCRGVTVVIGRPAAARGQELRRLQLAAEAGGTVGLLLRTARERSQPSWADVRLLVEPATANLKSGISNPKIRRPPTSGLRPPTSDCCSSGSDPPRRRRLLRLELIHSRGRLSGGAVTLEIDDATGDVRVASRLAPAESAPRAAGA